jgi:nitroimidazol reductase NimA-like FMN-containing flavoprotein (pyridoxamine 5'-phosphate oxidase superfamily)
MALPRELALTDDQLDEIMGATWNMRIATLGPGARINLTPMWFGWAGGKIYFYGRGQKIVNLRRSPDCSVLVDKNEKFPELQGAMFQGRAQVLENADDEESDPHLAEIRGLMGAKYSDGHPERDDETPPLNNSTAGGRNRRWVVISPDRRVTWDNFKLSQLKR